MAIHFRVSWFAAVAPVLLLGACSAPGSGEANGTPSGGSPNALSSGGGSSVLPTAGTSGSTAGSATGVSGGSAGGGDLNGGGPDTGGMTMGGAVGAAGVAGAPASGGVPAGGASSGGASVGGASVGGGGPASGPTAGCGKLGADAPGKDVLHNLMVAGVARRYWTKLPTGYTGDQPMPLVFYGPGCGASGVEGAPLDNSIKDSAIRVFVIGVGACFDTNGPEPETGYFNAVLDDVQANYCTDKGKVFVSGYSSGAWFTDLVSCTAGDRITGIGTAAGGFRAMHPPCKGNPAAMFHAGTNDGANPITKLNAMGVNEGSSANRDRLVMDNGCTMETKVWDPAFPYCKEYVGCKSPVVWCQQDGVGHSNGEEVARTGWWKFWSSLP